VDGTPDTLVEKTEYSSIARELGNLPPAAAVAPRKRNEEQVAAIDGVRRPFPKRKQVAAVRAAAAMTELAKASLPSKAYILDYQIITTLTNYTLRGDTTYYISNATVSLNGTTTIEGGTVVKFNQNPSLNRFKILGAVDCRTKPGLEATFTAADDDSIGEIIAGSTGSPGTNVYAASHIDFSTGSMTHELAYLHLRYSSRAVYMNPSTITALLRHVQIGNCMYGAYSYGPVTFRNVLMHDVAEMFWFASSGSAVVEQGTFNRGGQLRTNVGTSTLKLTNCLVIAVTNEFKYTSGSNVATNSSGAGVFTTIGAGAAYLPGDSPYRSAGTTNINSALLAEMRGRTTWPPVVLSNAIVADTVLFPQAARMTGVPDIGWSYVPLDYALSQVSVSNASLTIQAGTSIGVYGPSTASGLMLLDGANVVCEGNPTNLNRFVRYNLVQEQGVTNWSATSVGRSVATPTSPATNAVSTSARFRFTEWSMPANGNDHFYGGTSNLNVTIQDCEFSPGKFTSGRPSLTLLNNLFERTHVTLSGNTYPFTVTARNGTHFEGSLTLQNMSTDWEVDG
jgi:hypothetical protein